MIDQISFKFTILHNFNRIEKQNHQFFFLSQIQNSPNELTAQYPGLPRFLHRALQSASSCFCDLPGPELHLNIPKTKIQAFDQAAKKNVNLVNGREKKPTDTKIIFAKFSICSDSEQSH